MRDSFSWSQFRDEISPVLKNLSVIENSCYVSIICVNFEVFKCRYKIIENEFNASFG